MSTGTRLLELETSERLARFVPRLRGTESELRRLSVDQRIHRWLVGTSGSKETNELRAATRASLGGFVKGLEINDRTDIKRVSNRLSGTDDFSDQIWAFRIKFDPQYRFFGTFATPDWFVILNRHARSFLGSDERRWHAELMKSKRAWSSLFPGLQPHSGQRLSDYITTRAVHHDLRWTEN